MLRFKYHIKGNTIRLKRTKPSIKMAKCMFELIDINRNHLQPWFPWVNKTHTVEDILKYLFDKEEQFKQGKKIEYGIFVGVQYIGNIALFDINTENKSSEIGYWLSSLHTRKGYMTEAVKIIEQEAFETLWLHRVQIQCDEVNEASFGVAKKCWYKYEWKIRECFFSEYFNNFRNKLLLSKLKSDYKKHVS